MLNENLLIKFGFKEREVGNLDTHSKEFSYERKIDNKLKYLIIVKLWNFSRYAGLGFQPKDVYEAVVELKLNSQEFKMSLDVSCFTPLNIIEWSDHIFNQLNCECLDSVGKSSKCLNCDDYVVNLVEPWLCGRCLYEKETGFAKPK